MLNSVRYVASGAVYTAFGISKGWWCLIRIRRLGGVIEDTEVTEDSKML